MANARRAPQRPHYDLRVVRAGLSTARVTGKRATAEVKARLGLSDAEAEKFIREKLNKLTPDAFVDTVELNYTEGPILADVYGIKDQHGGWYLKLYVVRSGQVIVTSCHEPDRPLVCVNGKRIPGGEK